MSIDSHAGKSLKRYLFIALFALLSMTTPAVAASYGLVGVCTP